jgi:hypothetical protein
MRFNLSHSLQCRELEYSLKANLYLKLLKASNRKVVRLTGLGVGIASGLLTIASRIGLIFENFIKGIANLAGAPFSKRCSVRKGFEQLFANVPGHLIAIPYTLICASLELISKTFSLAFRPEKYCADKYSKFADREEFI